MPSSATHRKSYTRGMCLQGMLLSISGGDCHKSSLSPSTAVLGSFIRLKSKTNVKKIGQALFQKCLFTKPCLKLWYLAVSCVLQHGKDIMYQKKAPRMQLQVLLVSGYLPMSGMTTRAMYSQVSSKLSHALCQIHAVMPSAAAQILRSM